MHLTRALIVAATLAGFAGSAFGQNTEKGNGPCDRKDAKCKDARKPAKVDPQIAWERCTDKGGQGCGPKPK